MPTRETETVALPPSAPPLDGPLQPRAGDALLLVDIQRDFLPGGALAVRDGNRVVAPAHRCLRLFAERGLPVFASRDWHPATHCSFREQGGPWPAHCVAGTAGAAFAEGLGLPAWARIVSKATRAESDAYSAFDGADLGKRLGAAGVKRLFVAGLATDYCVLHSVVDAVALGLSVVVLRDAIAAVDVHEGDGPRALERMQELGVTFAESAAVCSAA
ncbi:MAG: isochorismatase family protein [Rubrivivax sp.]|nr:isochorismatase family protein [Rubrivivax sp.]